MKSEIWEWFNREYKVHCATRVLYDELLRWSGARMGGVYYLPQGGRQWDVVIPVGPYRRAVELLQIPSDHGRKNTQNVLVETQ